MLTLMLLLIIDLAMAIPSYRDLKINASILKNTSSINIISKEILKLGNSVIAQSNVTLISSILNETEVYYQLRLETPNDVYNQTKIIRLVNSTETEAQFNITLPDFPAGDYYYQLFVIDPVDLFIINQTSRELAFSVEAGNLIANEIEALQAVYGAELVRDKLTTFKIKCTSTFSKPISIQVNLSLSGFNLQNYLFTATLTPGINEIYIHNEDPNAPFFVPTKEGYVSYSATLDPVNKIAELDEADNTCIGIRKVVVAPNLKILFVPVVHEDEPQEKRISIQEFLEFVRTSSQFLIDTYPLPELQNINWLHTPFVVRRNWDWWKVLRELASYGLPYDRVVGVVREDWMRDYHQQLGVDEKARGISEPCCSAVLVEDVSPSTVAHELGHTFGLGDDYAGGDYVEGNSWPCAKAEGYWVRNRRLVTSIDPKTGANVVLSFMHATASHELYWVNNTDYYWLLRRLKFSDPEILKLSGIVFKNCSVYLDSVFRLSEGFADLSNGTKGDYYIVLLNDSRSELGLFGFNVSFFLDPEKSFFAFSIPWVETARFIQVRNNLGEILLEREINRNIPTVSIEWPQGGEVINPGENYTISWTLSNDAGGSLTYFVYLLKGNTSFIPIAININSTYVNYNFSEIAGGNDYRICIIASDGTNSSINLTEYFTISSFDLSIPDYLGKVKPNSHIQATISIASYGDFNGTVRLEAYTNSSHLYLEWINGSIITLLPNQQIVVALNVCADDKLEGGLYNIIIVGETNHTKVTKITYVYSSSTDISINRIQLSGNLIVNETITINVTVVNKGSLMEVFEVKLNCSLLQDPLVANCTLKLNPGQFVTISFKWKPETPGRYVIIAYAPIEGDVNSSDNLKITYVYVSSSCGGLSGGMPRFLER